MINGIIDSGQKIVTNGLVLHLDAAQLRSYPGSGTTWTDLSGTGNNGTLTNGPTFDSGNGGSIVFDGTNDYVNCGNSSLFNQSGGKSFTITCWALFNSTPAAHNPIFNKAATYGTFEYTLGLNSSRGVQWFTSSNGTSWVSTGVGENIVLSVWYYYAVGYDFTNQVAFSSINGKTIFTSSQTGIFNGNRNFEIGRHNDPTTTMNGRIASLNLYNKVLTAAEILQNYNATKSRFPSIVTNGLVLNLDAGNTASYPGSGTVWTDLSGNGNNGTLVNGPTYSSDGGGSIVFDNVNDYVSFSLITNNIYTIDFWYKMGGDDGSFGYFASSGDNGFAINEGGVSTGLVYGRFYYFNGSVNILADIPSTTNWNHICVIINTTTNNLQLFGNGNQLNNSTISSMSTSVSNVGRYAAGNAHFLKGNLASYKIYNRALSAAEVLQNFNVLRSRFGL